MLNMMLTRVMTVKAPTWVVGYKSAKRVLNRAKTSVSHTSRINTVATSATTILSLQPPRPSSKIIRRRITIWQERKASQSTTRKL